MKTGVIQPLPGIGDMVWFLPALRAIAASAPERKITLYTRASAQAQQLFGHEPMIEDVVALPPRKRGAIHALPNFYRTCRTLRKARPDRLYILHQSMRYSLAARLAGVKEIVAYKGALARSKENPWIKSLAFLRQVDIPVTESLSRLSVNPAALREVEVRFAACPKPWILVAPGASTLSRLWAAGNFARCADFLVEKSGGTVFLIGSPREATHIETIRALGARQSQIVTVTDMPFDRVMGLMMCSDFLLGNDSGPANVAAALGKPAFMLCGASLPAMHSANMVIVTPAQGYGMDAISVEQVCGLVAKAMNRREAASA